MFYENLRIFKKKISDVKEINFEEKRNIKETAQLFQKVRTKSF